MPKLLLSYLFKTNFSTFRTAILANNTNRICHILDFERSYISKKLDDAGNTALLLAIKFASPLTVQLLLQQGAYPDQPNFLTLRTPLSFLASIVFRLDQMHQAKLALEMATLLLDNGAYVDKLSPFEFVDEHGKEYVMKETPLMTAVRTKNLAMATLFVGRKANVNYMEKQSDKRPIHVSILNGDEAMFDLLEDAGASCRTVVTKDGNTSLHMFCSNKANDQHRSLLKKLIDSGCNIDAKNNYQRTPLMLAAKLNMINTCLILLEANADISKMDYRGFRAISFARLGSKCFRLLEYVTNTRQKHSQSNQNFHQILHQKEIFPQHLLSMKISQPIERITISKSKPKDHLPNVDNKDKKLEKKTSMLSNEVDRKRENDSKYKRMWDKFLHQKEKIRRTKHLPIHVISEVF